MKSQSAKRAWLTTMVHVVVPVSLTALLFVISIFFILLPYLERYLMDSRRHMIQELTTTVWVLIENYNDRVLSGELSLEEAQNRAKARIRSLRYGKEGKDYFWINDLNHHMVMHPYLPELEGSSLYDYADPDGTYLVRNFVETVKRKDAGFVGYKWQWKDDPKRIVPKESFVKLFEPWGWIIGTGVYLDDVHREIHAITARLVRTLVGILLLVGLLSAYSIWDGRKRELARAAADEALRNSEERFRQLANASWEAIAIHDNGVLLLANDQFFDMFGYMQPELLGSQILDKIIAPQSRLMAQKQINQFQPGPIEFVGLKRNGDTFPLEARSRRLDFRGRKAQVAVLRDISERKKMEEVMLHSEKMISVGGLAAGLAHEINNPLAGISQNLQVIEQRLLQPLPANTRAAEKCGLSLEAIAMYVRERQLPELIASARDSGRRASAIVRDMLSFSRKDDTHFAPCNLTELLDKTLNLACHEYDFKVGYDFRQIAIERDYAPDFPRVMCVASRVQQVFLNILTNGAHAMLMQDTEGTVTAPPTFTITAQHADDAVCISFRDNGSGMTEDIRRRIFEPFFTTKPVGVGTGLGLSVSYFIITKIHGGQMTATSEFGKGTTISITLPIEHRVEAA